MAGMATAPTLVDFEPGGVGAELLDAVGLPALAGEPLPGYLAWLPDRTVTLHRDQAAWHRERLRTLGDSERHRAFWALLDRLAEVFWAASRSGVRLPVRGPADALHDLRAVGVRQVPLARHLGRTLGDALRQFGLREGARHDAGQPGGERATGGNDRADRRGHAVGRAAAAVPET